MSEFSFKQAVALARSLELENNRLVKIIDDAAPAIKEMEKTMEGLLRTNWLLIRQLGGSVSIDAATAAGVPPNAKTSVQTDPETGDVTIQAYIELTDEEYAEALSEREKLEAIARAETPAATEYTPDADNSMIEGGFYEPENAHVEGDVV